MNMFSLKQFSFVGILLLMVMGAGFFFVTDTIIGEVPVAEAFGDIGGGCGGCDGGDGGGIGGGGDDLPTPSCTLTAQPGTITKGDKTTLGWNTQNAIKATIDRGVGTVSTGSGNKQVSPGGTVTYKMTVYNSRFQASHCTATVKVNEPAPAPTCDLYANPTQVYKGEKTTLSWSSTNAVKGTISTIGDINPNNSNGKREVTMEKDRIFVLTVENRDGNKSVCKARATVKDVPKPSCDLYVNPSTITKGDNAKVTWSSKNAVAAKLTMPRGTESVQPNGDNRNISPHNDYTLKLVVENRYGEKASCTAPIKVKEPVPAPTCTLSARPSTIQAGDHSTLRWSTDNATSASINQGIGGVATGENKSQSVSPNDTVTYTMTVKNQEGKQATCATKVAVEHPEPTPTCTLSAHPGTITRGSTAQLQYSTTNATDASVDQGVGQVPTGTNRTKAVSPQQTTTYTMTVKNADGEQRDCKTTVEVKEVMRTCDINADVKAVDYGGSVTLTWNTNNFDSVTINGSPVARNGSKTYADITSDTTYRLQAETADGSFDCVATINVICITPPPSCTLESDPSVITKGGSSTLRWSTEHAVHATINNGVGQVPTGTNKSRSVAPSQTTTYTMVVENEEGEESTCDTKVKVEQPTPTPVCDLFTADPETITQGESSTLTWETANVSNVYIDQGVGSVAEDGNISVSPLATTLYKLTAVGLSSAVGSDECYVKVKVEEPEPELPTCEFSATPNTLPDGGGTSLLEWDTENADDVVINNGIGDVSLDGDRSVTVVNDTQYVLTASNDDGDVSCKVHIEVEDPEPELPTCEFSLSPTSLPDGGGNVTLDWDTEHADEVTINQGVGTVSNDGSRMVAVTDTTLFTLTAENDYGDETCTAKVTVDDPEPDPLTCKDNVSFSARPDEIDEGETSELRWDTVGVDEVSINQGIGDVSLDGEYLVSPNSDTTYILTASNDDDTVQCPVTIEVDEDDGGGGGGTVTPRCELEVSDTRIDEGEEVELRWESRNAADIEITDEDGEVIVTTEDLLFDDKKDLLSGEIDVEPEETMTYTMVAVRGSRDDECTVTVRVDESDIVVLEERDQQPLVSSIALTQVPYTGFDAGPALTTLFYALLTAWALFVAYVVVRRRQVAMAGVGTQFTPVSVTDQQRFYNPELFVDYAAPTTVATAAATAEPATTPRWASEVAAAPIVDATVAELETLAHQHRVLVSHDAITYFLQHMAGARSEEMVGMMLEQARAAYPAEDGWVVLNIARMQQLIA